MTRSLETSNGHSLTERTAAMAVAVGVVLLVLIGFAASYATLRDLAVSAGRFSPWLAPAVPLSFDLGIVVLSLKAVLAAKHGRSAIRLRLLVAGLSAATVVANASAAPTSIGRLLHAIPAAMFVICFESATGSARQGALSARGTRVAAQTVRPVLLLLAPVATCRQWRRQVLKEQQRTESTAPELDRQSTRPRSALIESTRQSAETPGKTHPPVGSDPRKGDRGGDARLRCAKEELERAPHMTGARLADLLRARGHACSIRTAQRVKAQALLVRSR